MNEIMELLSYDKERMEESLEKYTKADLALLRKAYGQLKKEKGRLINEKKHFEKEKNSQDVFLVREKLVNINRLRDVLNTKIGVLAIDNSKRVRKEHIPVFLKMEASSLRDLDYLSLFLGEELTIKLKELDAEADSHKKFILLEEVIPCCEEVYKHTKEDLEELYSNVADLLGIKKNYRMKQTIHNIIKEKDYITWQHKIEYLQTLLTKLNRVLERLYTLRGIYKAAIEKEHKDLNKPYIDLFDENTLAIILRLVESDLYQKNEFVENLRSIFNKDIYFQFEEVEESFEVVTEDILASFQKQPKENVICLCNVMKNLIISKTNEIKRYLTKEDAYPYTKQLKKVAKKYEKVKEETIEKEQKPKKDYYLDILFLFLQNPKNYYYIERILEVVVVKMEEESMQIFVAEVIDLFIKNYKLKLANQKLAYTDPDYYFHILMYLLEKGFIPESERKKLNQILNDFSSCLCERKESPIRDEALMATQNLKNNMPIEPKKDELITVDIQKTVLERMNYLSGKQRKQDSDYPTKTFAVGKFAYSIEYNPEGDLYFRIHLLDGSSFIFENDVLDERIKKHMLLSEKEPFHLPYLKGKNYPVMTFQYRIYKNQSYMLKIFEDMIHIDATYQVKDLENYREIPDLKNLVASYRKLKKSGNDTSLDMYTESILLKEIKKLFASCSKEIPGIYKLPIERMVEDTKVDNHNQICTLLSKIDRKTAHQIFSILDETRTDIYCNYMEEDTYMEFVPFRYDTIFLVRTLKQILNETYDFNERYDTNKENVIAYCKALNEKNGYVSELFFEKGKKKVKK